MNPYDFFNVTGNEDDLPKYAEKPFAGGEKSAEDPSELLAEINDLRRRIDQLRKANEYGEHLNHKLGLRVAELENQNARLAHANSVTADGLRIERDELRARADRLGMRIKGLGYESD